MGSEYKVSLEEVELFLHGRDDEKYIVAIEYDSETNTIYKVKHDPEKGKSIEMDLNFKPFCWMKNLSSIEDNFYRWRDDPANIDKRVLVNRKKEFAKKYGITITPLADQENPRLFSGYKYLVTSSKGYKSLVEFFKFGGIKIYQNENFIMLPPVEQYLVQTGKRLFKGFEDYDDVHRLTFDLETQGLDPNNHKIYAIGVYDNKGYSTILEANTTDPTEEEEKNIILDLFDLIDILNPAIITSYNGFGFDWNFLEVRCSKLNLDFKNAVKTLSSLYPVKTMPSGLKIGSEVQDFMQYVLWGYHNIDINHATKKAQAIDSDMKNTKLKYVCKYSKINKKNRVYIEGNKIYNYWTDEEPYYFSEVDGIYLKHKPKFIKQKYITRKDVQSNLDKIYVFGDNEARTGLGGQALEMRGEPNAIGICTKKSISEYYSDENYKDNIKQINSDIKSIRDQVLLGKDIVFPEDGIGTGLAKLKEKAPKTYFHLQNAIKYLEDYINNFKEVNGRYIVKRYLEDDLWETMQVDSIYNQSAFLITKLIPTTYQKAVVMGQSVGWKLLMLEWSYFQGLAIPAKDVKRDFVGGLSRMLLIGFIKNVIKVDYKSLYPSEQLVFDMFPDVDVTGVMKSFLKYFHSERFKAKALEDQYKKTDPKLAAKFKRKQMPLKIFINSDFGSVSSPDQLPWADINVGERITCTARQFLRLAMKFFTDRGYIPLMNDTDGINFSTPDDVKSRSYIGRGQHPNVVLGKEYKGSEADIAEFNDLYLYGEMELAFDGQWESELNASKKNYITYNEGKIKLTGNSLKDRTMPTYIEEFFEKSLPTLLKGDGFNFIQQYYNYIEKIYNREIPLVKIADKAKVKQTVDQYVNRGTNIKGNKLPKQAHMELIIKNNLKVNIGDTIYYVNNGTLVTHGDSNDRYLRDEKGKYIKDDNGNKVSDGIYARLIPLDDIENNPDMLGDYNVAKYIETFNKKITPLLVAFHPDVRGKILIDDPSKKQFFTFDDLQLVYNMPDDPSDMDYLDEFFTPEPKEYKFWENFDYNPDIWKNENFDFYVPGYEKRKSTDSGC